MRILFLFFLLFFCCCYASVAPYAGKHSTISRSGSYILIHEHLVMYNIRNGMLSDESFSYIELIDLSADVPVLFKIDSYLLSDVIVMNDGKYSLGLSNISENGNPQLVLLSKNGEELMKIFIDCVSVELNFPCKLYQSGYVEWYDPVNDPIKYEMSDSGIDFIVSGHKFSYRK